MYGFIKRFNKEAFKKFVKKAFTSYIYIYIIIYLLLTLIPLLSLKRYYLVTPRISNNTLLLNNNTTLLNNNTTLLDNISIQPLLFILTILLLINFFIIKIIKKCNDRYKLIDRIVEEVKKYGIKGITNTITKRIKQIFNPNSYYYNKFSNNVYLIIIIIIIIIIIPVTKINKQEILPLRGENRNANRYNEFKINVTRLEREIGELDEKMWKESNAGKITDYRKFKEVIKQKLDSVIKEYSQTSNQNAPLPTKLFNFRYGSEFNGWFADRFRKREKFLDFKTKKIDTINPDYGLFSFVVKTKTNKPRNVEITITDEERKLIENNINNLYKWCDSHKIKCYIVWSPDSSFTLRAKIGLPNEKLENFAPDKTINKNIISVQKELMQYNYDDKNWMFYFNQGNRFDRHATDFSNYLVYKKVMEAIKKDIPQVKIATKDDFYIHCSPKMMFYQFYCNYQKKIDYFNDLSIAEKNSKDCKFYEYFLHKELTDLKITLTEHPGGTEDIIFTTNNSTALNKSIAIIGTSSYLDGFLSPFLFSFKKVHKRYNFKGEFKPDVLVFILNHLIFRPNEFINYLKNLNHLIQ